MPNANEFLKSTGKKRTRKPAKLWWKGKVIAEIEHGCIIFVEGFRDNYVDYAYSKAVHLWLGRAIQYLEQEKK